MRQCWFGLQCFGNNAISYVGDWRRRILQLVCISGAQSWVSVRSVQSELQRSMLSSFGDKANGIQKKKKKKRKKHGLEGCRAGVTKHLTWNLVCITYSPFLLFGQICLRIVRHSFLNPILGLKSCCLESAGIAASFAAGHVQRCNTYLEKGKKIFRFGGLFTVFFSQDLNYLLGYLGTT